MDVRADLYSLGCTLYFLLAGKPPFVGGSFLQKIERHRLEEAPPIERLVPRVSADVAATVRRLLAKQPEDRFASPAEVFTALGGSVAALPDSPTLSDVEAGSTVIATPEGFAAAPAGRTSWRLKLLMGIAVGIVLLFAAAAVLTAVLWSRSRSSSLRKPDLAATEPEVLQLALALDCGRKEGEVRRMSPRYGYQLTQGSLWDQWAVAPPAKSYCWFASSVVQFELKVPPRTAGILRLVFFDGDTNMRRQRLTVQGRDQGVFKDFFAAEKIVEVPISADDTRGGRIDVKIENVSEAANCVVSTVEFLERRTVSPRR